MVLLVFSMCACSREESRTTAGQETGMDDGGTQIGSANENDDGSETDTTEAINLFIVVN